MPLFAGKPLNVQGAALANLLALWLAGHVMADDPKATETMRNVLLDLHVGAVRELTTIFYREHVEPTLTDGQRGRRRDCHGFADPDRERVEDDRRARGQG
jgi:hypothetical protein